MIGGLVGLAGSVALLAWIVIVLREPADKAPFVPRVATANLAATDMFGAIEIGASGVKGTVWRISPARARALLSEKAVTDNDRYTAFKRAMVEHYDDVDASLQDAANAPLVVKTVGDFVRRMQAAHIPSAGIFIVASSGAAHFAALPAVRAAILETTGIKTDVVSPARECDFTFDWIVPRRRVYEALVIDVGSGNTKACYAERDFFSDEYHSFELLPYGTETFASLVAAQRKPGESFAQASARIRDRLVPLLRKAAADNPGLAERRSVYLAGGASWEVSTLRHPDAVAQDWVALDVPADPAAVRAAADAGQPYALDLSGIKDATTGAAILKELKRAGKVFTADQLLAGMDILLAIEQEFGFSRRHAVVLFARPARDAWMSRYLMTKLAQRG
ncbi:MAG: hypothetical protein WDN08_19900 [Rhizomicrobium sp.]